MRLETHYGKAEVSTYRTKGTALEGVPIAQTFKDGLRGSYVEELQEYVGVSLSLFGVRVFYNKTLSGSLESGNPEHPVGAASVKEMYDDDGDLSGWAVLVKTQDRTDEGRGWFWYEVTSSTDSSALAAIGNGVTGCVSCHSFRDQDQILSGFPLK